MSEGGGGGVGVADTTGSPGGLPWGMAAGKGIDLPGEIESTADSEAADGACERPQKTEHEDGLVPLFCNDKSIAEALATHTD